MVLYIEDKERGKGEVDSFRFGEVDFISKGELRLLVYLFLDKYKKFSW